MFGSSFITKHGLAGGHVGTGDAINRGPTQHWNLQKFQRALGFDNLTTQGQTELINLYRAMEASKTGDREYSQFVDLLDKHTGNVVKAFDGSGHEVTGIPMTFGDRTYNVGANGIKIVNEKLLDHIVSESIEREEYVNDVADLCLYVGNIGVAALSKRLYEGLRREGALPATIRNTTNSERLGDLRLRLKVEVDKVIDELVIPESTLEKLKAFRKRKAHDGSVDAKLLKTESNIAIGGE